MPKRGSRVGRCEGAREAVGVRGSGWCETERRVARADVSVVERREASGRANGKRFEIEGEDWSSSGECSGQRRACGSGFGSGSLGSAVSPAASEPSFGRRLRGATEASVVSGCVALDSEG
jgi:hypothetical protein